MTRQRRSREIIKRGKTRRKSFQNKVETIPSKKIVNTPEGVVGYIAEVIKERAEVIQICTNLTGKETPKEFKRIPNYILQELGRMEEKCLKSAKGLDFKTHHRFISLFFMYSEFIQVIFEGKENFKDNNTKKILEEVLLKTFVALSNEDKNVDITTVETKFYDFLNNISKEDFKSIDDVRDKLLI